MNVKITDEELLDEMKIIIEKLGRVPKQRELKEHSKYSCNAYKRAFGGINAAIKKLGARPFMDKISKDETIERIKLAFKKNPNISTYEELHKITNITYAALRYRFNYIPLHNVLKECNIPPNIVGKFNKQNITNNELKLEILRLKEKYNGRYPTYYDIIRDGNFSTGTYLNRFGSWLKTMKFFEFDDYVNQSIFKNQTYTKAKDSHLYKSKFEANIADILYDAKYKNLIKSYEYERKICNNRAWSCDFVAEKLNGDLLFIEVDGMMGNRKVPYSGINNEKINYYKANNLNLHIIDYYVKNIEDYIISLF